MKKIVLSSLLAGLLSFSTISYASDVSCKMMGGRSGTGFTIDRITIAESSSVDGLIPPHIKFSVSENYPPCSPNCDWRPSSDSSLIYYIPLDTSKHLAKVILKVINGNQRINLYGTRNDTFLTAPLEQPYFNKSHTGFCKVSSIDLLHSDAF